MESQHPAWSWLMLECRANCGQWIETFWCNFVSQMRGDSPKPWLKTHLCVARTGLCFFLSCVFWIQEQDVTHRYIWQKVFVLAVHSSDTSLLPLPSLFFGGGCSFLFKCGESRAKWCVALLNHSLGLRNQLKPYLP